MNVVIQKTDQQSVRDAFYVHYAAQKVMVYILQSNEITNTSSGDYTAIFHSPSAYDARSDRL